MAPAPPTLKRQFLITITESIERNANHGSTVSDTAALELGYWFFSVDLP
ncbi:nucleoside-diphosphate kinase [Syntrophotalea acetylenica]|nr:hypothetical protein [Syntrophotalea acetylenica]